MPSLCKRVGSNLTVTSPVWGLCRVMTDAMSRAGMLITQAIRLLTVPAPTA